MISPQVRTAAPSSAQAKVRLAMHFLGSVQLHLEGQNLTSAAGTKAMALLAYLAVAAPQPALPLS